MNTESLLSDIPQDLARSAYHGTSFSPEKRGDQAREGYAATVASDYADLIEIAKGDPVKLAVVEAEFPRYRERYATAYRKHLASQSRCISWMITGPANFPVARNEKRNRIERKRAEEMIELRTRALAAIRKEMFPELRPIMSGDSDACQRLAAQIAEAEKEQELMKATNAAIRSNWKHGKETVITALVALGHSQAVAIEMIQPGRFGGMGFASFELTNNGANLRRMKQRLEGIARNQALPTTEKEAANGIRLEDCPAENRVRLFFPGKPDVTIRTKLKSSGFRWTPSLGCWQAYRNNGTLWTAQNMITEKATP
jgi:hypothetical protein